MTHRLHVYATDETTTRLDQIRGPASRSGFIAWLIDNYVPPSTPSRAPEAPHRRSGEHQHTFKRDGQYLDRCECGEDRPHVTGTR